MKLEQFIKILIRNLAYRKLEPYVLTFNVNGLLSVLWRSYEGDGAVKVHTYIIINVYIILLV